MYIRKKKYPSGNIGIIVVEKINGKMKELATIGIARSESEVDALVSRVAIGLIGSGNGDSRVLTCSGKNAKDVRQNG